MGNYDFKSNIQKSVGGGGASGIIKTATHLTKKGWDDFPLKFEDAFKDLKITAKTYPAGTKFYRVSSQRGKVGSWWTTKKPTTIEEWRDLLAVKQEWTPNSGLKIYEYIVPKNKELNVWEGIAAKQPPHPGGGIQQWVRAGVLNPQKEYLIK